MAVSAETLTQLRNKSLSNKMLPLKINKIFNKEIAKLHSNNLIRSQNIYAYPVYEVWGRSENTEDSIDLMEPVWDYNDMMYPSRDVFLKNAHLSYNIQKEGFDYKHSNNNSDDTQKILNTDVCVFNINERSMKITNTSEIFSRDKQGRMSRKEYYRLCYDSEDSNDDSYDYPGEIFQNEVNSTSLSGPVLESSRREGNSKQFTKNIFDESEFVSVDLMSGNYNKELFKNKCPADSVEKTILKGEPFEDYWQIA